MFALPSVPLLTALNAALLAAGYKEPPPKTPEIAEVRRVEGDLWFAMSPPPDVPLASTIFLSGDDLEARFLKYRAVTGKTTVKKRIVVEKSKRVLTVYADGDALIRYPVQLGFGPVDDKLVEGDGATPEGELYVCTRNEKSAFYRFLGLSYPRPADAERGFSAKLISAAERDAILKAHRFRGLPPWETALGGKVGIHGGAKFIREGDTLYGYDWTWGCVAVTDEQALALYNFAELGTEIFITK
jgi:hypothetical protein